MLISTAYLLRDTHTKFSKENLRGGWGRGTERGLATVRQQLTPLAHRIKGDSLRTYSKTSQGVGNRTAGFVEIIFLRE